MNWRPRPPKGNGGASGNGTMPWWARLPTTKLVVVGGLGLLYKHSDDLLALLTAKVCG